MTQLKPISWTPTRRIACSSSAVSAGFSLLEIIVVTAIIGIMATMLVGALIQDNDRTAKLEAERLLAVVAELQDEAVLLGTPFLLTFSGFGYTTTTALGQSSAANRDSLLRDRRLQAGVSLDSQVFQLDEELWFEEVSDSDAEQDEESEPSAYSRPPSVLIDSMGEITEFEARFKGDDMAYTVLIGDKGGLTIRADPL